jgi:RNA polymerase sigma-70 factor (ECF subfamily)
MEKIVSNPTRTTIEADELERIYFEYKDRVSEYIRSRIRSVCDAEDLLSCVFLEVTGKASTYDSSKASLSTWIYVITRNIVNNHLRRVYRIGPSIPYEDISENEADDGSDIDDVIIKEGQLSKLASALELLPQREREIIILRFYYDKPSKEVAGLMNLSDENVRYLQNKAIKKLRELILITDPPY